MLLPAPPRLLMRPPPPAPPSSSSRSLLFPLPRLPPLPAPSSPSPPDLSSRAGRRGCGCRLCARVPHPGDHAHAVRAARPPLQLRPRNGGGRRGGGGVRGRERGGQGGRSTGRKRQERGGERGTEAWDLELGGVGRGESLCSVCGIPCAVPATQLPSSPTCPPPSLSPCLPVLPPGCVHGLQLPGSSGAPRRGGAGRAGVCVWGGRVGCRGRGGLRGGLRRGLRGGEARRGEG